jgi:hypothetical protein
MLIKASGTCEKCGRPFTESDKRAVEQSINLSCINKNCGTKVRYCKDCKKGNCPNCGGKLLDLFELNPNLIF